MLRWHVGGLAASFLWCALVNADARAGEPYPAYAPAADYAAPASGCASCGTASADYGYAASQPRKGFLHSVLSGPCGGQPCDKPWGCTTFCDEKCFLFGSCRQFFSKRPPYVPPPGLIPPGTTPCEYGTWHRW